MTALMRLRLSGRALSSLGLLMLAVVIGVGAAGWGAHGSGPARTAVILDAPVLDPAAQGNPPAERVLASAPGGPVMSATTSGGGEVWLPPHRIRLLVGTVVMTGLASGSLAYWVLLLGPGLYLSAAADRNRLRRLFCGCRHGTRAPPLRL